MDDEIRVRVVRLVEHQLDKDGKPICEDASQRPHGILKELLDIEVVERENDLLGTLFARPKLELLKMNMVPNGAFLEILVLLRRKGKGLGAHQHLRSIAIGTGVKSESKKYMTRIEGEGWKEKRMAK